MNTSIIIIGAGAAGLQAGRRLSAAGCSVTILEAGAGPGGRVLTLSPGGRGGFSVTAEGGAEFIHGDLPLTKALANEAGVALHPVASQMVRLRQGRRQEEEFHFGGWDELLEGMARLPGDKPFAEFLTEYFPGDRYAGLRDWAGRMAEGYDLADLRTASTRWLYREWSGEEREEGEYRPEGGYGALIAFLARVCLGQGCELHYSSVVEEVRWERGRVTVGTSGGGLFTAERLLVTVSLGVLKTGAIRFYPDIPVQRQAVLDLGYGAVTKVLLEFDRPFWQENKPAGRTLFVLSDEAVPTWWTQNEDDCPLLTGWVSGARIGALRALEGEGRIMSCLQSLAAIFGAGPPDSLRSRLRASLILDWESAPAIRGGYSFDTVGAPDARAVLRRPVEDTLYFAGEGLYEGDVPGTVEAAFCSGVQAADALLGARPPGGAFQG